MRTNCWHQHSTVSNVRMNTLNCHWMGHVAKTRGTHPGRRGKKRCFEASLQDKTCLKETSMNDGWNTHNKTYQNVRAILFQRNRMYMTQSIKFGERSLLESLMFQTTHDYKALNPAFCWSVRLLHVLDAASGKKRNRKRVLGLRSTRALARRSKRNSPKLWAPSPTFKTKTTHSFQRQKKRSYERDRLVCCSWFCS